MTDLATPTTTPTRVRRWWLTVPASAGIAYTAAWIAGLSVSSASTDVHSTGAELVAAYTGHQTGAIAQFVLTEGVASVFLAVVAFGLARSGRAAGARRAAFWTAATGGIAALIAFVQCGLGIVVAGPATSNGDAATAGTLSETINRLDGVKMFLLAGLALAGTALARRVGLPAWLRFTGPALAVAIVLSGVGYLFLLDGFSVAAWVSLPLLLVWVTGTGIVLGRNRR
ncbi:hypothetical protein [Hamadaea tsunoensis]|uniref:hypothetical protein n=1 Tax=Hamadaea tsunoensis TaxID=53368 RepID=UPI0004165E79|nr:hypothetical protein [Hamadaea tsunoensis]